MITYKNITDVEVLEQASENTKVLVNEGGELMQAPYSNFEDKMKDAEVLEEIPENAMALINDGGKLKQVSCGAFGSGVATIILRSDAFEGWTCENMTFSEAEQLLISKTPMIAIEIGGLVNNDGTYITIYDRIEYIPTSIGIPENTISFNMADDEGLALWWREGERFGYSNDPMWGNGNNPE